MYGKIIFKSFKMRKARYILPTVALLIGVSVGTAFLMVSLDMDEKIQEELRNYGPNMIVVPKSSEIELSMGGMNIGSISESKYIAEGSAKKVRDLPLAAYQGKVCREPGANAYIFSVVKVDNKTEAVLAGTWFDELRNINTWWELTGNYPKDNSSVLLGRTAAQKLGKGIGDVISVQYSELISNDTADYYFNSTWDFTVTGIARTGGEDDSRLFAGLDIVQSITNKENKVNIMHMSTLCNKCSVDAVGDVIEAQVPGIECLTVRQIANAETDTLGMIQSLVGIISIISIGASVLAVTTTMTLSVNERRKEIGLMKAVGAQKLEVAALFLGEGTLIGLVGGLLGFFLGIFLAQQIGQYVFESDIAIQWWMASVSLGISLGVVLLASIIPVKRALDVEPATVLTGE
jgi:putative ABC transport system permease protein